MENLGVQPGDLKVWNSHSTLSHTRDPILRSREGSFNFLYGWLEKISVGLLLWFGQVSPTGLCAKGLVPKGG
jgi:hypothetical protein